MESSKVGETAAIVRLSCVFNVSIARSILLSTLAYDSEMIGEAITRLKNAPGGGQQPIGRHTRTLTLRRHGSTRKQILTKQAGSIQF